MRELLERAEDGGAAARREAEAARKEVVVARAELVEAGRRAEEREAGVRELQARVRRGSDWDCFLGGGALIWCWCRGIGAVSVD